MTKPELTKYTELPTFKYWVQTVLPAVYDDSLSFYELLSKVIKQLNDMGVLLNTVGSQWDEIIEWVMGEGLEEAVIELLTEWWESGKFDDFFNQAIEELKMLRTSAFIGNIKYKKIHYRVDTLHTSVWLTDIPYLNEDGTRNVLKRGFANDTPNGGGMETAREFSDRHKAAAVFNASTFNVGTGILDGSQITNGASLKVDDNVYPWKWYLGVDSNGMLKTYGHGTTNDYMISQGVKEGMTAFFPVIQNSVKTDSSVWAAQSNSPFEPHERHVIAQRTNKDYVFLTSSGGLRSDFENGLTMDDVYNILTDNYNDIEFAYALDGGGSAQAVVYGTMINRPADGTETTERPVPDFLYFSRDMLTPRDTDIYNAYKNIGYVRKELANLESAQYYNHENHSGYVALYGKSGFTGWGIEVWNEVERLAKLYIKQNDIQMFDIKTNQEIFRANASGLAIMGKRIGGYQESMVTLTTINDNLIVSGDYYCNASTTGNPYTASGFVCEVRRVDSTTTMQKLYPLVPGTNVPKYRIYSGGVWGVFINL